MGTTVERLKCWIGPCSEIRWWAESRLERVWVVRCQTRILRRELKVVCDEGVREAGMVAGDLA